MFHVAPHPDRFYKSRTWSGQIWKSGSLRIPGNTWYRTTGQNMIEQEHGCTLWSTNVGVCDMIRTVLYYVTAQASDRWQKVAKGGSEWQKWTKHVSVPGNTTTQHGSNSVRIVLRFKSRTPRSTIRWSSFRTLVVLSSLTAPWRRTIDWLRQHPGEHSTGSHQL